MPKCTSKVPELLDEFGPRGWFDVVLVMRPLGEHFGVAETTREARGRLCPACAADKTSVATLSALLGLGLP